MKTYGFQTFPCYYKENMNCKETTIKNKLNLLFIAIPLIYNETGKENGVDHFYLVVNIFKKIALFVYTSKCFTYIYIWVCFSGSTLFIQKRLCSA